MPCHHLRQVSPCHQGLSRQIHPSRRHRTVLAQQPSSSDGSASPASCPPRAASPAQSSWLTPELTSGASSSSSRPLNPGPRRLTGSSPHPSAGHLLSATSKNNPLSSTRPNSRVGQRCNHQQNNATEYEHHRQCHRHRSHRNSDPCRSCARLRTRIPAPAQEQSRH